MAKRKEKIPRFRIKIEDEVTGTVVAAGSDDIKDFMRPLPPEHKERGCRHEMDRMMMHFRMEVKAIESGKLWKERTDVK